MTDRATPPERGVRLQRFLAQAGIASRRRSEDLIAAGLVQVNGRAVTTPGTVVDPENDEVTYRGRRVTARLADPARAIGIALHKPRGVLTTRGDARGRRTVYDLIREPEGARLIYVGRLDLESEGLLLFTTSGELAHRLMHPRWEVERAYRVTTRGGIDERALLRGAGEGITLSGRLTGPFRARVVRRWRRGRVERRVLDLILTEGRNREVRRIVRACGGEVERLIRTRYAFLTLGDLAPGRTRRLTVSEMAKLRRLVGLPTEST